MDRIMELFEMIGFDPIDPNTSPSLTESVGDIMSDVYIRTHR